MRLLGFEITRASQALATTEKAIAGATTVTPGSGGWFGIIREPWTGAWQRNISVSIDTALTYSAVYRCIALISSDIAKMRIRLVELGANNIWHETTNPAYSPVLRKPNRYQSHIQFFAAWMESKLVHGNAYVLKVRDQRSVVIALHVLSPDQVSVLVAPDGDVFYELRSDDLAGVPNRAITVPASEIIHDRGPTFYHPLVGTSPIQACGLAALQGLKIQENSTNFFTKGSAPGGLLSAPTAIPKEKAQEIKQIWDENYAPGKPTAGTVAVLSGGMTYTPMTVSAADAQLLEQLKWTAETVASVFGVPAYKIGVGGPPTYNNVEALDAQYYTQCLQIHIEQIEELLDLGLGLGPNFGNAYGTEFDLDTLLRMDTATKVRASAEGVKAGFVAPNEARMRFDLDPVEGGDSPYLQVQNYSLSALNKRDQQSSPVTPPPKPVEPAPTPPPQKGTQHGQGSGGADRRLRIARQIERAARRRAA